MPHLYHYITVYDKRTGRTTTEKHYSGGPQWGARGETWWSTYRCVHTRLLSLSATLTGRPAVARNLEPSILIDHSSPCSIQSWSTNPDIDVDTDTDERRYQLEAFVDMVRGREPAHWITLDSSIAQMDTIDMVYEKAGLGRRMPTPE